MFGQQHNLPASYVNSNLTGFAINYVWMNKWALVHVVAVRCLHRRIKLKLLLSPLLECKTFFYKTLRFHSIILNRHNAYGWKYDSLQMFIHHWWLDIFQFLLQNLKLRFIQLNLQENWLKDGAKSHWYNLLYNFEWSEHT